ncbi:hypothetical protein CBS101457_001093 [Exobasidium rhododendri]|nr:hypothetical protein CBS101457_001093 [Exobasidium rhododendri]
MITVGDGSQVQIECMGDVALRTKGNDTVFILRNALLCTKLTVNVLSTKGISAGNMGYIAPNGSLTYPSPDTLLTRFSLGFGEVVVGKTAKTLMIAPFDKTLHAYSPTIECSSSLVGNEFRSQRVAALLLSIREGKDSVLRELTLWHKRLGHPGISQISMIAKRTPSLPKALRSIGEGWKDLPPCRACVVGQRQQKPFGRSRKIAAEPFDVVHIDLSGIHAYKSISGSQYFMVFLDDWSRMTWVYFMQKHDHETLLPILKKFLSVKGPKGEKVKKFHADNEFNHDWFRSFCDNENIEYSFIQPHTPQHNSRVERMMRTLKSPARAMLGASGLPLAYWEYAISVAAFIRIRLPHRRFGIAPYKKWHGRPPNLAFLRTFGCLCYPYYNKVARQQDGLNAPYDVRACIGIFLGYSTLTLTYIVYLPQEHKFTESRDVVFNESAYWTWSKESVLEHRRNWSAYNLWPEDASEARIRQVEDITDDNILEHNKSKMDNLSEEECHDLAEQTTKTLQDELAASERHIEVRREEEQERDKIAAAELEKSKDAKERQEAELKNWEEEAIQRQIRQLREEDNEDDVRATDLTDVLARQTEQCEGLETNENEESEVAEEEPPTSNATKPAQCTENNPAATTVTTNHSPNPTTTNITADNNPDPTTTTVATDNTPDPTTPTVIADTIADPDNQEQNRLQKANDRAN